jgi:hypothetical protein
MPEIREPAPERSTGIDAHKPPEEAVTRARALPEIGERSTRTEGETPTAAVPRMPEIGDERPERETAHRPTVGKLPEIDQGKARPKRQAYDPEKDEDDPILRLRGK